MRFTASACESMSRRADASSSNGVAEAAAKQPAKAKAASQATRKPREADAVLAALVRGCAAKRAVASEAVLRQLIARKIFERKTGHAARMRLLPLRWTAQRTRRAARNCSGGRPE